MMETDFWCAFKIKISNLWLPTIVFEQIGSTLKQARRLRFENQRRITAARISGDYLSKLEMGAFDQLPAPAYVHRVLRSYGQCVALDQQHLWRAIMIMTDASGNHANL
jgi:hypothetical protein